MEKNAANLEVLSTRSGFNSAVRQIKKTLSVAENAGNNNLGDLLFELGDEDFSGERAGLLLRMLLIDKLGYKSVSSNLGSVVSEPEKLAKVFDKWKAVDLVVAYHHPEMGLLVANPKMAEEISGLGELKKRELLVIYAGKGANPPDENCQKAAALALKLFEGNSPAVPPALLKGNFTVRKLKKAAVEDSPPAKSKASKKTEKTTAAKKTAAVKSAPEAHRIAAPVVTATAATTLKGPVKMTPRYAVVVQNELFHNGNVEAWKRIITSYKAKYPALEVFIYYDGERILDINSLFKWGKVKHGSAIEFAVAGNEIKDVAKLQRYLSQGSSNMFEAFLRGPVNTVLRLFG